MNRIPRNSIQQNQPSSRDSAAALSAGQNADQTPALTLPTGGGSIRGIDEKFQVNPATGSGAMSIPIPTSPARQGFGPQLALSYDSGSGSGPFGLGWSLSLPRITRKTDRGLPTYLDSQESDVFILSGAEDLVPVLVGEGDQLTRHAQNRTLDGTPYLVQRYRPRVEGLSSRIERWTNQQTGDIHWRSITRDNVTTQYGLTSESRIADPEDPFRIFSWLICESYDDRGNAILFRYKAEDSQNVDRSQVHERNRTDLSRSANRYLKTIHYGNQTPRQPGEDLSERTDWMFEVLFDYGDGHLERLEEDEEGRRFVEPTTDERLTWPVRQDPMSDHRAGFEARTYRLCRRIMMFHHFPDELGTADYLVRATHFDYTESPIHTVMARVIQSGYLRQDNGAYQERSLPPVEFEYSRAEIQSDVREVDSDSLENLPVGLAGSLYRWVDLDGEGISGLLSEQGGGWFYKPNLGGARFSAQEKVALKPSLSGLNRGQQLLDLAGDGQLDVVTLDGPVPGFYERTQQWTWEDHKTFASLPSLDWNDPNLRFVDLTGDGHADVLITEDRVFSWYPSLAEEGFGSSRSTPQSIDDESGPRLLFADVTQSIYLADMSGDGLADLVRIRNGLLCYWPNLGYGRFGAKVSMDNAPLFDAPDLFDQRRIRLADVDGSGITDILYIEHDRVSVYFNEAGNSWAEAQFVHHFPSIDNLSDVTAIDLLGNGTACLVWSSPLPAEANRRMRYIDLMGGLKPHLLIGSRNNLGTETRLHYAASTRFYLEDKAAGRPWITRLPFPVHVVERVETFDHINRNRFVTRYAYHHGYFDGVEREFRGFGMVEQFDTEEFASLNSSSEFPVGANIEQSSHVPPLHTRTWFHTGVYIGRQRVSNYFAGLLDEADTGEYYREPDLSDDEAARLLLPDTILPEGLTVEEEREACRALKEVYALDGSPQERHPYSVTEQNATIRMLQPRLGNRHGVFFTHTREALSYHYERNPDDPRVSHAMTLAVDDFGNVLHSAVIGYGRRQPDPALQPGDQQRQAQLLMTCSENSFTNTVEEEDLYRVPLPSETFSFELTGLALGPDQLRFGFDEMREAALSAERIAYHQTPSGGLQKRVIEQARTLYRRNDLSEALPLGELQSLALPFESYQLAFTPEHLDLVFDDRVTENMLRDEGRYDHFNDEDDWWIPSGLVFMSPNEGDDAAQELAFAQEHFFMPLRFRDPFDQTALVEYDTHDLLMVRTTDPLQSSMTARQDYRLLAPELVSDANGNRSAVAFDVLGRVAGTAVMGKESETVGDSLDGFQAQLTQTQIDAFFADPRGPTAAQLLGNATSRIVYDESRFQRLGQSSFAATIARETHVNDLGTGEETVAQVSLAYSDGFNRTIQNKIQAEPGPVEEGGDVVTPRWTTSGWTIFNNKGDPVRQFEPFFSAGHAFEFGTAVGVSPTLFYDPIGRVVATLHPNHTWEKVVFDPWRQERWDVNDTVLLDPAGDEVVGVFFRRLPDSDYLPSWHALRTDPAHAAEALARWPDAQQRQDEASAADKAAAHVNTPAIVHLDSLGRAFLSIADNGPGGQQQTRTEQDIEGTPLRIIDDRGNAVVTYQMEIDGSPPILGYDVAGRQLYENSMDAGESRTLTDVDGKPIRSWDSLGHTFRTEYDALGRPLRSFVIGADPANPSQEFLVERLIYGEQHPEAEQRNLRGTLYLQLSQAGAVTTEVNDFKANSLQVSRRPANEYRQAINWSEVEAALPANATDEFDLAVLEALLAPVLEADAYQSSIAYDALNRLVAVTTPHTSGMQPSVILPGYNEANLLERMHVRLRSPDTETPFVTNLDYNAKGQRERIIYATSDGTNVTTGYEYEADTFRLSRLVTQRHRDGRLLQDLKYTYDPVGNITSIRDSAQQAVFFSNTQIEPHNDYTYDAVYRLIHAEGREHAAQNSFQRDANDFVPVLGVPFPNSPEALQRYAQEYAYDTVGNILSVRHIGGAVQRWTRRYQYADDSNRLLATSLPGDGVDPFSASYSYDAHGNMTTMPHLPIMRWDFKDQLQATSRQLVNDGTPEMTYYVYNAAGERARKVTERQAPADQTPTRSHERLYLGGFEIYREYSGDGITVNLERETLHVMDDQQRIAQIDMRTQGDDGSAIQTQRFQLSNHLGSAMVEVDEQANVISYEEYHPYGTSAYQAGRSEAEVGLKRHRFTGKERDEETGLYFHGARYNACWLGRWTAADPIGIGDGVNLYIYSRGNPVRLIDSTGTRAEPPVYEGGQRPSDLPPLEKRNPELARKLDRLIDSAEEPEGPAGGYPVLPEEPPPVGGYPVLPEDDASADASSTESEVAYYVILQGNDEGGETNKNTEAGGKAAAFAEGIAEGLGTGIAIRGGLYVIGAVLGGPVATVFGVGLLVYGLYELSTGGAEALVNAGTRIATGEGTEQDYETAGVVLGGIIGGVRGRGRKTNATLEPQPAGPLKNRSGNLEEAARAARTQPHGSGESPVGRAESKAPRPREQWVEVRQLGREDARAIINKHREAARLKSRESGRHTWPRQAAQELERAAKEARKRGMLEEYVQELESAAQTMRRREAGHRGGITGRGRR